jgi:aminoglycoside phosphotransferase (APT) family kinase protein
MATRFRRDREADRLPSAAALSSFGSALAELAAADGPAPGVTTEPEPVLAGYGAGAYRFELDGAGPGWRGPLIVRTGSDATLAREATWIAAMQAAGFPVPELATPEPVEGMLVFRQPAGTALAERMLTELSDLPDLMKSFAALHTRLHRLPLSAAPDLAEADPLDELDRRLAEAGVGDALRTERTWLGEHRPTPGAPVPCHGDFNPVNVHGVGDASGDVVVNWTRARRLEAEFDAAVTLVGFWSVPLYLDNPVYRQGMKVARDPLIYGYLDGYWKATGEALDETRLRYWQGYHLVWLGAEVARRAAGRPPGPWEPPVHDPAGALSDVRERFVLITQP